MMGVLMIRKEIRRDVVDKKGRVYKKLVGVAIVAEDSISLELRDRDYQNAVKLDICRELAKFIDKNSIEAIKGICKSLHESLKNSAS